jgi:hypothetical protein
MTKKKRTHERDYIEDLRLTKSLLISSSLQKRLDVAARRLIEKHSGPLVFKPLQRLMIERKAWEHVRQLGIKPQLVFCHPDILIAHPVTSLYYRGMAGLSIKAAKDYFGAVEALETGRNRTPLVMEKAVKMASTYNMFISSIIVNSLKWTLENGHRTILATMGISLDGTMRNKVGDIGEDRVRRMILEWLIGRGLVREPHLRRDNLPVVLPRTVELTGGVSMRFSSEPDISFIQNGVLKATVEIKGGIDPAGALERYGAAMKSFEHAIQQSGRCRNFYLGGVFTEELNRRIKDDRLVEKTYSIIVLLQDEAVRADFFRELFHHTLRIA